MGLLDNQTQQEYYDGNDFGNYQFTSLDDIIDQFMIIYVGEDKIISKIKRTDVAFHAQRAMQELSFDTFKSCKSQEITVPASLQMTLPQDYVNYTKISWIDSAGIKHLLYPTSKTSNPSKPQIDSDEDFLFDTKGGLVPSGNLITNGNFHGGSTGWILNQIDYSTGTGGGLQPVTTSTSSATLGDPVEGYFFGFDGNTIKAYAVPQYWGIRQDNIPILSGEEYKITYTISGYSSGSFKFKIIDENGDNTNTTAVTADGTYTETITAGGTSASYPASSIIFMNDSSTAGTAILDSVSIVRVNNEDSSTAWANYKSTTPSENQDDYIDDTYWPIDGERYGLDPQHAQINGSYYIDCIAGKIHFSSNISGKTVVLDYISDSLGTDDEMQVKEKDSRLLGLQN
jgi:flagellar basal body rod protein FlgC